MLFRSCLKVAQSHISTHAKWLVIRGHQPWTEAGKLLPLLPNLDSIEFSEPNDRYTNTFTPYHPSIPRRTAGLYASLVRRWHLNIETVWVRYCTFVSPDDLLHLLSAFPGLRKAFLMRVAFENSHSAPLVRPRSTELNFMTVMYCSDLWPIPYLWTWRHPSTDRSVPDFPGIAVREARVASAILRCMREPGDWIVVQLSKSNASRACECTTQLHRRGLVLTIVWVQGVAVICGLYFDLEFYAYGSDNVPFAEIRYVFLRFRQRFLLRNLIERYDGLRSIARKSVDSCSWREGNS